jgi:hypothetical protein
MLELNEKDNIFATIINKKDNKEVATLSLIEKSKDGMNEICLDNNHVFQLIPFKHRERTTMFITAESGGGKSHFVREWAKKYHESFPKNPIYLISYLEHDETLDAYKEIIRINAFNPKFLEECMELDLQLEFSDSCVIYDDVDSITNKNTKQKIYGLLNKMLRLGRHYNISVCYLGHEAYASHELKAILNESMSITFFLKFLNYKKLKYLLEVYFGLSREQIERVRNIKDSRAITYIKGFEKVILSEHMCFIL